MGTACRPALSAARRPSCTRRLRRRLDLLDGGGHGHLAAGAARRQGALAEVVRRDDRAIEAQRRHAAPLLRWGSRSGRTAAASSTSAMAAAARICAEASWYPDAQLAVVVLMNSEPTNITMVTDDLAAAVLPVPPPGGPIHRRRVAAGRHIQGSRARQGDGHRGDEDAAGDRVRHRWRRRDSDADGSRV